LPTPWVRGAKAAMAGSGSGGAVGVGEKRWSSPIGRRLAALGMIVAACAMAAAPTGAARTGRDLTAYQGLGTWLDVYDRAVWRDPASAIHAMAANGVKTLFLETGNSRQYTD